VEIVTFFLLMAAGFVSLYLVGGLIASG